MTRFDGFGRIILGCVGRLIQVTNPLPLIESSFGMLVSSHTEATAQGNAVNGDGCSMLA